MPKRGEKSPHRNWKLLGVPVGPEQSGERQQLAHGSREHILSLYDAYRQETLRTEMTLVVTDERGRSVYACSR